MRLPPNAAPLTGLLKPGAPVLTHSLSGTVKRLAVSEDGSEVQYLVAYEDPVSGEPHERFFRPEDLFVPAAPQEAA